MRDDVETNGLGKRTALSKGYNVSILDREGGGAVGRNILVPLLETTVLLDVMQVVPSNNNCSLHLRRNDLANQNSSTNGDVSSEGALLVHVASLDGSVRSLDSKTDILDEAHGFLTRCVHITFAGHKDSILLLVSLFVLCCFRKWKLLG